jgi:hypothetical protein
LAACYVSKSKRIQKFRDLKEHEINKIFIFQSNLKLQEEQQQKKLYNFFDNLKD